MAAADDHARVSMEIDGLVDEYRLQCLWFLRRDFYPKSDVERIRVLRAIERHGDLSAFRRASTLRQWLLRRSSEPSVVS